MKAWKKTVSTAAALLLMSQPVLAATLTPVPAIEPDQIRAGDFIVIHEVVDVEWHDMKLTGEVTYVDLEGGFYSVAGWRLILDEPYAEALADLEGQWVTVIGTPFQGFSIQMVKAIEVTGIEVLGEAPRETRPMPEKVFDAAPIRILPAAIAVDGKAVAFDQLPVLVEDNLMVPLRAVATAAGAAVEWSNSERAATVTLADRTLRFSPNPDITVAASVGSRAPSTVHAAQLVNNRLLVRADLLVNELGLKMDYDQAEGTLHLVRGVRDFEPGDEMDEASILAGDIEQIDTERNRILVRGHMIETGHPNYVWITISDETVVIIEEDSEEYAGSFADFSVGASVHVEIVGPMLLSYPAQAGSPKVTIKR